MTIPSIATATTLWKDLLDIVRSLGHDQMAWRRTLSAIGLLTLGMADATAVDITLAQIMGEVQVQGAGFAAYRPALAGSQVRVGDRVRTGKDGWAVLAFGDDSRVVLTAGSEFLIRHLDGGRRSGLFSLLAGKLRATISHRPEGLADYRFNTLTATAGIRGTDFALIHRGQANVFFGNTGRVQVRGLGSGEQFLTADTVVQTTRGLDPIPPIALDPASPLSRARQTLNAATDSPPASWAEVDLLPEIIARWNINYSRYLADAGRHSEALAVLQVALDLTDDAILNADAHLERAAVHGREPDGAAAALAEYALLLDAAKPAQQRETALFMTGKALHQMGRRQEARARLRQYMRDYPDGRYSESCETLLRLLADSI
ncbi:MAG TPA: FecR domain-containing protein [Thiobacillaceae bacterium]|nr:FecR domain-containing protein [Thiobacillaceae bacterium]